MPSVTGRLSGRLVSIPLSHTGLVVPFTCPGLRPLRFHEYIFEDRFAASEYKSRLDMGGATNAGGAHQSYGGTIRIILRNG